jgi:hypothetical protein
MASIYKKGDSPVIWIHFKDETGKWRGKPTSYRWSNFGDVRQAKLMARRQSEKEVLQKPAHASENFENWVLHWIQAQWGSGSSGTLTRYKRLWVLLGHFLQEQRITAPLQIRFNHAEIYRQYRLRQGVSINTVILELQFLSQVMRQAVRLGYCPVNPLVQLGMKKAPPKEKQAWTDEEIRTVSVEIERSNDDFLKASFYLGLYQAARLRQCQIPLDCIDFKHNVIHWPAASVKGYKAFSQPIDPRLKPMLKKLVDKRREEKHQLLAVAPAFPSLKYRDIFKKLGLPHLCHHGLRVTWITRAAINNVHPSQAMQFVNHGTTAIHRAYQKLNVAAVAHVPSLLSLPELTPISSVRAGKARRGNARASLTVRTKNGNR